MSKGNVRKKANKTGSASQHQEHGGGTQGLSFEARPRSLDQSLDPRLLSSEERYSEIQKLRDWLPKNRSHKKAKTLLMIMGQLEEHVRNEPTDLDLDAFLQKNPKILIQLLRQSNVIEEMALAANNRKYDKFSNEIIMIHNEIFGISFSILKSEDERVSPGMYRRLVELIQRWRQIKLTVQRKEDEMIHKKIIEELSHSLEKQKELQHQLVNWYHIVYSKGGNSETKIQLTKQVRTQISLRDISHKFRSAFDSISDIYEDVNSTGGFHQDDIKTFADKLRSIFDLIEVWGVVPELASDIQREAKNLERAINVIFTGLEVVGMDKYLIFFAHIPKALAKVSAYMSYIEQHGREKNTQFFNLDGEVLYPKFEPGPKALIPYMKTVFTQPNAGTIPFPKQEVVDYFNDHIDMFRAVESQVMGRNEMPTSKRFIFWEKFHPNELNGWVYENRQWIYRVIYGPERHFPNQNRK